MVNMQEQAKSMPLHPHPHDLVPRISPFVHHTVTKYGKNSFMWYGPTPSLILTNPEQIKEVFNKYHEFTRGHMNPLMYYLSPGLVTYEGDQWAKLRKMINPAFSLDKLKALIPTFAQSYNDMIREWEKMVSLSDDGTSEEVDVWPWFSNMSRDVISKAAVGSSYEEGRQIFDLITEQTQLVSYHQHRYYLPFWRFVHAKDKRRMEGIDRTVNESLKGIIQKKEKALKAGEATKNDILGRLIESNLKGTTELSMMDLIEECKLFYFAGQETTSTFLVWTIMLLSRHLDWQTRAREEVLQVFGKQTPDFDGLSRLTIVNMILYEVLRLYPPATYTDKLAEKDMKLGNLYVPAGVQIYIPLLMLNHDQETWGSDAKEFKPERFREGISKAGKGNSVAFFPFGWGPRICIGQNFALFEVKTALSLILQRFWFELSPSYSHAPSLAMAMRPKHGVHVILHKLES
ncbi:11-oxo-beta-amyrin 30-oxidase-like [Neltuma alba]|uniref:11-oxo-beta-amyrin 30-oxidase-like n=1 Tax=Neltuma alba TaxID=207710 RepID=UPI0010A3B316|nr:11-oxo-beta-amyrin 30-oxidase-like [Prosopis alba]